MIKGMAVAGMRLGRNDFIQSAERALDFIHSKLWKSNRLLASYKDGKAHLNAYLDDYVFLIEALMALLQARWRESDFNFMLALADAVVENFQDDEHGGFYFTSHDHEPLIQRPKNVMDESTPSGNGVAAYVLIRLGHLLGDARYSMAGERAIKSAWDNILRTPYAHNTLLDAVEEWLYPTQVVMLRGEPDEIKQWQACSTQHYSPRRFVMGIPNGVTGLPEAIQQRAETGSTVAYVCDGYECKAPITDISELGDVLKQNEAQGKV
jgi:hypothetical protein